MLVIRVELWPGGDADRAKEIGRAALANVSDLAATSSYLFTAVNDRGERRAGILRNHERAAGFWRLLERVAGMIDRGEGFEDGHGETLDLIAERAATVTTPRILR